MTTPNDPAAVPQVQPKKKSKLKWVLIIGGLISACCLLSIIGVFVSSMGSKSADTETVSSANEGSQAQSTEVSAGTSREKKPAETAAPATKDIYKVGEKADGAGIAITVLNVQKVNKVSLMTADAGKTYLDVEVLIENVSRDETTPYNALYFKVKDDTAAEYTPTMMSIDPSLKSGDLIKGDKARGHVAFEVSESAKGFVLSYEPMVLFGGYKTIRVNLDEKTDAPAEVGTLEIGDNQVGQRFESAGIAITVVSVQTAASINSIPADEGMVYLDFEVLIENVSHEEKAPYNPLYFKVKDSQFLEYNTAMFSQDPSLTSGNLVKGDKVRGHVAFQVPADSKKFVVSYEPEVLFGGYKTIAINIVLP